MKQVLIGQIGVDSGQLMIIDPCYIKHWIDNDTYDVKVEIVVIETGEVIEVTNWLEPVPGLDMNFNDAMEKGLIKNKPVEESGELSYSGACRATLSPGYGGILMNEIGAELACAFNTRDGDGVYPVYANVDADDRVVSVEVKFQ